MENHCEFDLRRGGERPPLIRKLIDAKGLAKVGVMRSAGHNATLLCGDNERDTDAAESNYNLRPLMTAKEVGEILCVPTKTVMNLGRAGDLPRHKIGSKTVRFDPADVYEYLQKTRIVDKEEDNRSE